MFTSVARVFYRAVAPDFVGAALQGSRAAGRYSSAEQPTLYLSSSPEGVEAAMIAHRDQRAPLLQLLRIEVHAERIFDLRDAQACQAAGIDLQDAVAPWQETVAEGRRPSSWNVRDHLLAQGAVGLIDPSRKAPGLWHLVLFAWNQGGNSADVRVLA